MQASSWFRRNTKSRHPLSTNLQQFYGVARVLINMVGTHVMRDVIFVTVLEIVPICGKMFVAFLHNTRATRGEPFPSR